MIEEINKFFNDRPLIGLSLIILLILLLCFICNDNTNNKLEHLTSDENNTQAILPMCTINTDQVFNSEFVGASKVINFKCTIKDVDYYLTCVKTSEYEVDNPENKPDCTSAMLILVPAEEINTMLGQYSTDLETAEMICNSTMKIQCQQDTLPGAEEECQEQFEICKQPRLFLHDFNVVNASIKEYDPMVVRKYIIKGTAAPLINGVSSPTMFNQILYNDNGINFMCGDTYNYGQPNIPKEYAEVIIIERNNEGSGSIIGGASSLKVKLKFNTILQLKKEDTDENVSYIPAIDQCTGKYKTKPSYMGICGMNKTCTKNGKTYQRVCLYDDILGGNVLEFEPIVVNVR